MWFSVKAGVGVCTAGAADEYSNEPGRRPTGRGQDSQSRARLRGDSVGKSPLSLACLDRQPDYDDPDQHIDQDLLVGGHGDRYSAERVSAHQALLVGIGGVSELDAATGSTASGWVAASSWSPAQRG